MDPIASKLRTLGPAALAAAVAVAFTWLLAGRLGWAVFDSGCPTYALNMIRQIMAGRFPATFPGIPEAAANYHQGTFVVAAGLARALGLEPLQALRWTVLVVGAATFVALLGWAARRRGAAGVVVVAAAYLSASPPTAATWPLGDGFVGWYSYVSLAEYLASTSWPVALLLLGAALAAFERGRAVRYGTLAAALLLLPWVNATAFTLAFLAAAVAVALDATGDLTRRPDPRWAVAPVALAVVYLLPRYYPSAFATGRSYDPVRLAPRLLDPAGAEAIGRYLLLHPVWNLVTLWPAAGAVRRGTPAARFAAALFLLAFAFPLLVWIESVDTWDNVHKFVLLCSFSSIFVWVLHPPELASWRRWAIGAAAASLLLSFPSHYNLLASRFVAFPRFAAAAGDDPYAPLAGYLATIPGRTMLWVYGEQDQCGALADLASRTDAAVAGLYSPNFLVAPDLERTAAIEGEWFTGDPRPLQARHPGLTHLYVAPGGAWRELALRLAGRGVPVERVGEFGGYAVGINVRGPR